MKIKTFRTSGNPVRPEDAKAYQEEWQKEIDVIFETLGKHGEKVSKAIDDLETKLKNKYNDLTIVELDLPTSAKAWKSLISDYGNIMLTTAVEENEHAKSGDLLFVINDMPF